MSIAAPITPKTYAAPGTPGGVPLSELASIVGSTRQVLRYTEVNLTEYTATACVQLDYLPQNSSRSLRIQVNQFGGTYVELFNGSVDPLSIHSLIPAEAGDTLIQDGSNTQTGYVVIDDQGGPIAGVLVGRTAEGFLLLQAAIPQGRLIDVFSEEYDGGLLAERLARQAASPPRQVSLRGRFATPPTEVPRGLNYNGSIFTNLADNSGWVQDDRPLSGTGIEYLATATATYNPLAGYWIIESWTILSTEGGTLVQYGAADTGPWHETREAGDLWRRWRDAALMWHIEPLDAAAADNSGWTLLTSYLWNTFASPPVGSLGYTTQALSVSVDLNEWKWIVLEWSWGGSSDRSQIALATKTLRVASFSSSMQSGFARSAYFRRGGAGASYDDADHDSGGAGGLNRTNINWQLMQGATNAQAGVATLISFDMLETSKSGTFRVYGAK